MRQEHVLTFLTMRAPQHPANELPSVVERPVFGEAEESACRLPSGVSMTEALQTPLEKKRPNVVVENRQPEKS
jgi:hypothetical protein